MRRFVLLLSAVFLLGISTHAQAASQPSSDSAFTVAENGGTAGANFLTLNPFSGGPATPKLSSSSVSFSTEPAGSAHEGGSESASAEPAQDVYGVRPIYPFEAYFGYTFLRFYEVPGTTVNTNGFNYSIQYYPKTWVGADGEFVLGLGNQYPFQARFLLGLGGVRVRTTRFRQNVELWAHVLAGATHFTPQTAYGKQGAFAYELGVGGDINLSRVRYAIRVSGDMVGTRYFGTGQLSPKISAGFVYRF